MDALERINQQGLFLLGCGKMGSAMLEGWLGAGVVPGAIHVRDPGPSAQLRDLASQGLHLNEDLPTRPALCLIAVKPQVMTAALPDIRSFGGGGTLILSIAAGTPISSFEAAFGRDTPIVRAMPNTPAAIGKGITALVGNASASDGDMDTAEHVLRAIGQTVRLQDEEQIDAVTGVSGSGPAYVFHMIECLAAAGQAEGLAPELAMRLAKATVSGAGQLAETSADTPEQLRINVTSPRGTTEAGLSVLMDPQAGLPALLVRTVAAAAQRSRDLRR